MQGVGDKVWCTSATHAHSETALVAAGATGAGHGSDIAASSLLAGLTPSTCV